MKTPKPETISRRDFLKWSGVASTSLLLSACAARKAPAPTPAWTPVPPPSLTPAPACTDLQTLETIPPVSGKRYRLSVPATLDLQERAELVLGTMTNCTDPKGDYAPYDRMDLWRNPPIMHGTTMLNGKYVEATALLRHMTGSTINPHVDASWRRHYLEEFEGYPWWGSDPGRMLAWIGNNYRMEQHNPCWLDLCLQKVKRALREAVCQQDYCYYPDAQGAMPTEWAAVDGGWALQGLVNLYAGTAIPEALDLAGKVARFLKDHSLIFDPQGQFVGRQPSDNGTARHFHTSANALEGIAAYALAADDEEFGSFARSSYEWARTTGSPRVGFFPEYINDWPDDRPYVDCETCCTADMIQIAMSLTLAGQGDYWNDVDRYVRNQFAEMQLLDGAWIDAMTAALPPTTPAPEENAERLSEKLVGSFASWAVGNDWYMDGTQGTTFCCIGNGARALYYVWDRMVGYDQGRLTFHLLLNRASRWADLNSYIPNDGRVDLKIKAPCELEARIPEWVQPGEVKALVNQQARQLSFRGRYAQLGRVAANDLITLTFPISEKSISESIGNVPYKLIIRGNDVVSIDPPGRWYPFYQKELCRQKSVHWIERERFVPEA